MSTAQPLTPEEQKQLQALQERDAKAKVAEAEKARQQKLAAMPNLVAFVDTFAKADPVGKLASAIANQEGNLIDSRMIERLYRLKQVLDFDGNAIVSAVEVLRSPPADPVIISGPLAAPTPRP